MPRAIYHLSGQELEGDPYDIPEVRRLFEEQGIDWLGEGRPMVKKALSIILNVRSPTTIYRMTDQFPEAKVPLPALVRSIKKHHAPIRDSLFKGSTLSVMNLESEICNNIILEGMTNEVIILPIFDSFIIDHDNGSYMYSLMNNLYKERFGFQPAIH